MTYKLDALWILGNYSKNPAVQEIKLQKFLPLKMFNNKISSNITEFIYEPSQKTLLNLLIPKYFFSMYLSKYSGIYSIRTFCKNECNGKCN
jgi:F0F1-type ATP synthase gamma subunit